MKFNFSIEQNRSRVSKPVCDILLLQQTCYKSAAGLLQVVRFDLCSLILGVIIGCTRENIEIINIEIFTPLQVKIRFCVAAKVVYIVVNTRIPHQM